MTTLVSSRDVVAVMLGKSLTMSEIVAAVESHLGVRVDESMRRNIVHTMYNLKRSRNADITTAKMMERGFYVNRWMLKSVNECYFRSSSAARRAGAEKKAPVKTKKKPKRSTELRSPNKSQVDEINICRLARAVDIAWRGGGWVAPEFLVQKKYGSSKSRVTA